MYQSPSESGSEHQYQIQLQTSPVTSVDTYPEDTETSPIEDLKTPGIQELELREIKHSTSSSEDTDYEFIFTDSSLESATNLPRTLEKFLAKLQLTEQDLQKINLDLRSVYQMLDKKDRILKSIFKVFHRYWVDNLVLKIALVPFLTQSGMHIEDKKDSGFSLTPIWPKSRSVLFQNRRILATAYAFTDAQKAMMMLVERFSSPIFYSLLLNEVILYLSQDKFDAGEFFKLFTNQSSRMRALIGNYIVGPALPAAVIAWAAFKGLKSAINSAPLSEKKIEGTIELLNSYQPNWFYDSLRWLIPLPGHPYGNALRLMERALSWDGRLSPEQRENMLQAAFDYTEKTRFVTQIKAMYVMMDLLNTTSLQDMPKLAKAGYDSKTVALVLKTKAKANKLLRDLADNFKLVGSKDELFVMPFIRFTYANYLLWYIGRPSKLILQPFFLGYEIFKAYAMVNLAISIIRGLVNVLEEATAKASCQAAGNIWSYIPEIGINNCTTCADLDEVPYLQSFNPVDCYSAFTRLQKTADELVMAFERFSLPANSNITLRHSLNATDLGKVVTAVKKYVKQIDVLSFGNPILKGDLPDEIMNATFVEPLRDFFQQVQIRRLDMASQGLTNRGVELIARALSPTATIKELNFPGNLFNVNGTQYLFQAIPPSIEFIDLSNTPILTEGMVLIANQTRRLTNLRNLALNNVKGLYSGIQAVLNTIPETNITALSVANNNDGLPRTATYKTRLNETRLEFFDISGASLSDQSVRTYPDNARDLFVYELSSSPVIHFKLGTSYLGDTAFQRIAETIKRGKRYKTLDIGNTRQLTLNGFKALAPYLPNSGIEDLGLAGLKIDLTLTQIIAPNFPRDLTTLNLGYNSINDTVAEALLAYVPAKVKSLNLNNNPLTGSGLAKLPTTAEFIYLERTLINDQGMATIAKRLNNTYDTKYLSLDGAKFTPEGVISLAEVLPYTGIEWLTLSNGNVSYGLRAIAKVLPNCALKTLSVNNANIATEDALSIPNQLISNTPIAPRAKIWVDYLRPPEYIPSALPTPKAKLSILLARDNKIGEEAAIKLCEVKPYSYMTGLQLQGNPINASIVNINTCKVVTNSSSLLAPNLLITLVTVFSVMGLLNEQLDVVGWLSWLLGNDSSDDAVDVSESQETIVYSESEVQEFIEEAKAILLSFRNDLASVKGSHLLSTEDEKIFRAFEDLYESHVEDLAKLERMAKRRAVSNEDLDRLLTPSLAGCFEEFKEFNQDLKVVSTSYVKYFVAEQRAKISGLEQKLAKVDESTEKQNYLQILDEFKSECKLLEQQNNAGNVISEAYLEELDFSRLKGLTREINLFVNQTSSQGQSKTRSSYSGSLSSLVNTVGVFAPGIPAMADKSSATSCPVRYSL